jgi:hypothetical protein
MDPADIKRILALPDIEQVARDMFEIALADLRQQVLAEDLAAMVSHAAKLAFEQPDDEAWAEAAALLRARGEDPEAMLEQAARNMAAWDALRSRNESVGPLEPAPKTRLRSVLDGRVEADLVLDPDEQVHR